jgi:DNA-binding CsgD family transcriptional regulator
VSRLRGAALRARREAVVELWRQGRSAPVIAARLGLTVITVRNDVKRARTANPDGVPQRQRAPLTAVQCAEICVFKAEGRSPAAIARALRVSDPSVRRALRIAAMAETARDRHPAIGAIGSQIVAMWEAGHTGPAIADRFGLARVEHVYRAIGRLAPELSMRRHNERKERGQNMLHQVAALHEQSRSYREIACALGIPLYTVRYYVHRGHAFGTIPRRGPLVSNAQRQEIMALNAAGGISGCEIARRLNFSPDTVYRVLDLAGVAPSGVARRQLKSKILELWETGWKSDAIADACGVTVKYVYATAYQAAIAAASAAGQCRRDRAHRRAAPGGLLFRSGDRLYHGCSIPGCTSRNPQASAIRAGPGATQEVDRKEPAPGSIAVDGSRFAAGGNCRAVRCWPRFNEGTALPIAPSGKNPRGSRYPGGRAAIVTEYD